MRLRDWTLQYNLIWAANEKPPTECICPEGYEPYQEECRKVSTKPATQPPDWDQMELIAKPAPDYGLNGMRIYNSDYNIGGSMTDSSKYTAYDYVSCPEYWYNFEGWPGDGTPDKGPMNRCALWTSAYSNGQSIGFSVCVNIGETKTYLIGIGVDNYMSFRIDGSYFLNMDSIENDVTFKWWHVYPLVIKKGFHVIEIIGHNVTNIAAVGIQIYDATPAELLSVTSDTELSPYLVFDSKNEIGNYHTLGNYAYPIDSDYALVLCDGTPYYRKVEYTECVDESSGINGKIQIAAIYGYYVLLSFDYGVNWSNYYISSTWQCCAINSDGTMFLIANNSGVYKSIDEGVNWNVILSSATRFGLSMNETGQYIAAADFNGYLKISDDYGVSFISAGGSELWVDVSVSRTGQYMVAVAWYNKIKVSNDYGITWVEKGSSIKYENCAISGDGKYMIATGDAKVYFSYDYGMNWNTVKSEAGTFNECSISQNGEYIAFVKSGGKIYVSSNYGNSFSERGIIADWTSLSMDSTGQYMTAAINNGALYTSSDYGQIWISRTGGDIYRDVAISKGYV